MALTIAKIIFIRNPLPFFCHIILKHPFFSIQRFSGAETNFRKLFIGLTDVQFLVLELIQLVVLPTHCNLNNIVQLEVTGPFFQKHTTPDRRIAPLQRNL